MPVRRVWLSNSGPFTAGCSARRLHAARPLIPSLGDGVMLGTAWIDWTVDTRGYSSTPWGRLGRPFSKCGLAQPHERGLCRFYLAPASGSCFPPNPSASFRPRQTEGASEKLWSPSSHPARLTEAKWRSKSEDWQAKASLATTAPLDRWAIYTAAPGYRNDEKIPVSCLQRVGAGIERHRSQRSVWL